jgi:acetyl esterase/lipase
MPYRQSTGGALDTCVNWNQLCGIRCAGVQVPGFDDASPCLFLCHGGAYISAGDADLRGLPPLLLQVGNVDLSFEDVERLRARAKR